MNEELELFKKGLGERIAFLRKERGLTQAQLGALIEKDFQSVSRIENGGVNASGYLLKQIARALNITMNELFNF